MRLPLPKMINLFRSSFTPNKPHHVQWLLTYRCNYRCRGCNVWREQKNFRELSAEEIKMGLDVLRKFNVIEIVLSGGNPLLRDDISEIIDYASRFFITTVYDNGSVAVEKIDSLHSADFVAISLDSLDEKKNDYIKGLTGAWKKAMNAVETLHEEGINVGVSPTISQLNIYEIADFTRYFTERDIPVWYCLYCHDPPAEEQLFTIGKQMDEFEIADEKTMVNICETLNQMKKSRQGVFITSKTLTALRQLFLNGQRIWKCKALQDFFILDPLGRVAGCHLSEPVTSVFDLPKVWKSQKFDELRKEYETCSRCAYLCYIFYSLHSSVFGNLEIAWDQWKNFKLLSNRLHGTNRQKNHN